MSKNKISFIFITLTLLLTGFLLAGSLTTTNPPEPTSYTLEDIYNLIHNNTTVIPHTLTPSTSPTATTSYSISDIYIELANLISREYLETGITYLGITGNYGVRDDERPIYESIPSSLTPTTPQGENTTYTLNDIYELIVNNATTTANTYNSTPSNSPAETMHTLTEIYEALQTLATSKAPSVEQGVVYLGVEGEYVEIPFACGDNLVDTRDSKSYATVLIGSQCWMQQNLNVGTMINVATNMTDNSTIEKYCYNNDEGICNTDGALYQWNEVMQYTTDPGAQGICPTGWHVPTHDEFTDLEREICTSGTCATDFPYDISTTGWRGTDEGTTMKDMLGVWQGILTGYRTTNAVFAGIGSGARYWSSTTSVSNVWYHYLSIDNAGVYRFPNSKTFGFSLRCLKD